MKIRTMTMGIVMIGMLLLTGCIGQWFSQSNYQPSLIIGRPAVTGDIGKVLISVAGMPQEGVASIAIDDFGIAYENIVGPSIKVEGMNGFDVLVQDFTTTSGKGRLVAANPNAGVIGGTILKVTFKIAGGNPIFTINEAKVSLASALDTLITNWHLAIGHF